MRSRGCMRKQITDQKQKTWPQVLTHGLYRSSRHIGHFQWSCTALSSSMLPVCSSWRNSTHARELDQYAVTAKLRLRVTTSLPLVCTTLGLPLEATIFHLKANPGVIRRRYLNLATIRMIQLLQKGDHHGTTAMLCCPEGCPLYYNY